MQCKCYNDLNAVEMISPDLTLSALTAHLLMKQLDM